MLVCILIGTGFCDQAHAEDRQVYADVDCVVVGLHMVQMASQQQSSVGLMLAIYYLGRLDGRVPDSQVKQLIETEAKKMNPPEFRANAVRCGKALTARGQEIQEIGADLVRKTPSPKAGN
jgi:hypothetical protein